MTNTTVTNNETVPEDVAVGCSILDKSLDSAIARICHRDYEGDELIKLFCRLYFGVLFVVCAGRFGRVSAVAAAIVLPAGDSGGAAANRQSRSVMQKRLRRRSHWCACSTYDRVS